MIALLVMLAVPPPPTPTRVQVAPLTCSSTDKFSALSALGVLTCSADTSGGAAPATAQYWVGAADATLSAEKNLGALSTGLVINTGGVPTAYAGATCGANQYATQTSASGALTCAQVAYSQVTGTPTIPADLAAEPFITKTATANLSNEFALGSLATGLLVNTATTGVPTIKGTNTCTNQFPRSDNASGTWTCASIATADLPTVAVTKGGTGLATIAVNQIWTGTAADTVVAKTIPTCSDALASKLLYNNSTQTWSCGVDQTGGAGSSNFVEKEVDFGATGSDLVTAVITGEAWVSATSKIICGLTMLATADRADGVEDAIIEKLTVAPHTRVVATGFSVTVAPAFGKAFGKYLIHCTGSSS